MRSWVIPTTLFCLGLGLGFGIPILGPRYMEPYMPNFFQKPLHPLEGVVAHKQHDQDRLLMTVTTQDGTILATFRKQVAEIALLVEEQDSITLDVRQYEPFVNDPPILKVKKQIPSSPITTPVTDSSPPFSIKEEPLPDHQLEVPPLSGENSDTMKPPPLSTD